jgi:hypothetical protein
MQFDLGLRALHKFLDPRRACYIGRITEDGPNYAIEITYADSEGNERQLVTTARQLAPMSFSYEIGDKVVVSVDTFMQTYILGLAEELNGVDLTTDFYMRFGKNIISGKKDGSMISMETGDGNLKIVHDAMGTKIDAKGLVTVTGDVINVGSAVAPALNACTACPLQGVHVSTVPTISIG